MTRITQSSYQEDDAYSHVRRISWSAVFAGAVLAIVTQITLTILGMGIGIGTIDVTAANPAEGLGTGSLIWWVISNIISIFIGAWVAGRLAGIPRPFESILHGLLTWGVYSLFSFYILTTAVGSLLGGVGSAVGQVMDTAGQGITLSDEDRERIEEEGREAIAGADDEETRQEVRAFGDEATTMASRIGIFLGIGLILGAGAGAAGGKFGETHDLEYDGRTKRS
ncbi:MAG: hypothetical protein ACK4ND_07190 [Cytophagaceae bacterium]